MFRIKTDIRQYRCESRDKVERLIRNWVIRPADLIYDDDSEDWLPIGEHPAFVEIFEQLSEKHENQPETVVTDSVADKAATDRARLNNDGDDANATRRRRPQRTSTPAPSASRAAGVETDEPTSPPTPDSEVVGVIRDSDEVTLMTARTRALMIEQRGDTSVAVQADPTLIDDETTDQIERPELDGNQGAAGVIVADDEPTNRIERPDFDGEDPHQLDEPTNRVRRSELERTSTTEADPEEPTERFVRPDAARDRGVVDGANGAAPGESTEFLELADNDRYHELPAHIVTEHFDDETEREQTGLWVGSSVLGHRRRGPQLEMDQTVLREFEKRQRSPGQPQPLRDTEEPHHGGEEYQKIDPLRDTDELHEDGEENQQVDPLRETGEIHPGDPEEDRSDQQVDLLRDTAEMEYPADTSSDDLREVGPRQAERLEVDGRALDEAFERVEDSAMADSEEQDQEELPEVQVSPVEEITYDGYSVEFLFPIGPSASSEKLGLKRSSASERKKAKMFPAPEPKTPGEVVTARYRLDAVGWSAPQWMAAAVAAVVVGLVLLVVLL